MFKGLKGGFLSQSKSSKKKTPPAVSPAAPTKSTGTPTPNHSRSRLRFFFCRNSHIRSQPFAVTDIVSWRRPRSLKSKFMNIVKISKFGFLFYPASFTTARGILCFCQIGLAVDTCSSSCQSYPFVCLLLFFARLPHI